MGLLQISNILIPLITFPYLTRVLGAEAFGKVVFAQLVMTYFSLVVDYGFSWSATGQVAAHRADRIATSRIFASTWATQWLLLLLVTVIATTSVIASDRLRPDVQLYAAAFSAVIGTALFPVWFLQGLEHLKVVALIQIFTRTIAILPIFLFVRQPDDAISLLLIQGFSGIFTGVLSLSWIHKNSLVEWHWPRIYEICNAFRTGGHLFFPRVSVSLYTTLIPLTLGWIAEPVALAYFNLADKLRSAAQSLLTPLLQALFPRMSHLVGVNGNTAFLLIKRSAMAVFFISGCMSIGLWALSEWAVLLVGGIDFSPAAEVLRWLAPLPLIVGLSNILGVQIMLPLGFTRAFNAILASAAVVSVVLIFPMTRHNGAIGAAQTILIVEALVTTSMAAFLWRHEYFTAHRWGDR